MKVEYFLKCVQDKPVANLLMGCCGGYAYNYPSARSYAGSYDDSHMMMSHRWAPLDQYDPLSMAGSRRSPYYRPSMAAESPMQYAEQYKWWLLGGLLVLVLLIAAYYYYSRR